MTVVVRSMPGRIRLQLGQEEIFWSLQKVLKEKIGDDFNSISFKYSARTGRALVIFPALKSFTENLVEIIKSESSSLISSNLPVVGPVTVKEDELGNPFWIVAKKVGVFYLNRFLTPMSWRPYTTAWSVAPTILTGVKTLIFERKLNVDVLDAAAIGSAMAMRDYGTAGVIHLLLDISETLEEWTKEKSKRDLAGLFGGDGKPVWVLRDDEEVPIMLEDIEQGDLVVIRSGARIPVDGVVQTGTAMVNQASMTGEPLAVQKDGASKSEVFAGTVVEEGKIIICSEAVGDDTCFAQIAQVITESEQLKAGLHSDAEKLADKIVPFSFVFAAGVYAVTRNWVQAAAVLMADYSCAIKLATPLAVRSGMVECAKAGALVKGGKFIEQMAKVDAVVLDKTGTLTEACPQVIDVLPVNGFDRDFVLTHAACLEEHFPHPVADSIVQLAHDEGLDHDEVHSEVDYILAHGISSHLDGQKVVIGSRHFIHEDEGISLESVEDYISECASKGYSTLYMGVGGKLAAVFSLEDPLRQSAPRFIRRLEGSGVKRIILLTGDGEQAAKNVADILGIEEYYAQVLPEDKTALVNELKEDGYTVAMLGDGINDSAALSSANVGVSMKHGADIAREACDVMLTGERLDCFIDAMEISQKSVRRIKKNFAFIVASNTSFIGMGVVGIISPALLAFLHNTSTVLTCANSMRPTMSLPQYSDDIIELT